MFFLLLAEIVLVVLLLYVMVARSVSFIQDSEIQHPNNDVKKNILKTGSQSLLPSSGAFCLTLGKLSPRGTAKELRHKIT